MGVSVNSRYVTDAKGFYMMGYSCKLQQPEYSGFDKPIIIEVLHE